MAEQLQSPPPPTPTYLLSYPAPFTLLITINRPKAMNSLPYASHWEADSLIQWFDGEPSLRVAIVTGAGETAFCAGQDLIEQGKLRQAFQSGNLRNVPPRPMLTHPPSGFMGISRREGRKPIIAAVNGYAFGGGFEICLNCDMVVASPKATFALPEGLRGIYPAAGGLARIVRICGLQVATEVAMTGRVLSADEATRYLLVNRVSRTHDSLLQEAVELAKKVADLSPDAVIIIRHGLRQAWEEASVERAAQNTENRFGKALREGENVIIGLMAFAQKKKPQWVPSRL